MVLDLSRYTSMCKLHFSIKSKHFLVAGEHYGILCFSSLRIVSLMFLDLAKRMVMVYRFHMKTWSKWYKTFFSLSLAQGNINILLVSHMKFQCYTIFTSNATTYPIGVHYALPVNIGSRQKGYGGTNLFTELPKISVTK